MSIGNGFNTSAQQTREEQQAHQIMDTGLRNYMLRVYNWMASGLLLTAIVSYVVANTSIGAAFFHVVHTPAGNIPQATGLGYLAMFSPLAFVLVLSFGIQRLSLQAAQTLFWVFCASMGASFASIFYVFTGSSIFRAFLVTACMFGATSLWGYTTKANLVQFGSFLMMGLFGMIIAGVVNMFMHSPTLYYVYSIVGVLLFTAFSAFDVQRIRMTYPAMANQPPEMVAKYSVYDALSLYLDFINLFQIMLQFMGMRDGED